MAKVPVTIEIKAQRGKPQELYQTLQALLPTMRKDKEYLGCRISRDVEDGTSFLYPMNGMHRAASRVTSDPAAAERCLGPLNFLVSQREYGSAAIANGRRLKP
jgi:hypothetical protein